MAAEPKTPIQRAHWALQQYDELLHISPDAHLQYTAAGGNLGELQRSYLAAASASALVAIAEGIDRLSRELGPLDFIAEAVDELRLANQEASR
jgi:hypothetical protein